MHREDLIYLAGFIDGEGVVNVRINRRYDKYMGRSFLGEFAVHNTNKEVIEWVFATFGGFLDVEHRKGKKTSYECRWRYAEAVVLLPQVIPFLKVKRRLAELLYEFVSTCTGRPVSDAQKMRAQEIAIACGEIADHTNRWRGAVPSELNATREFPNRRRKVIAP